LSCSQTAPTALRLRTESFSFSNFFKGPLLSNGLLLLGELLLSGYNKKVKKLILHLGGRYFWNTMVYVCRYELKCFCIQWIYLWKTICDFKITTLATSLRFLCYKYVTNIFLSLWRFICNSVIQFNSHKNTSFAKICTHIYCQVNM